MEVLILTVFASVALVAGAVLFFAWNLRQHSHEHIDRLALLPLSDDSDQTDSGIAPALRGGAMSMSQQPKE